MRSAFHVGSPGEDVWIACSWSATFPEGAELISPETAAFRAGGWFPSSARHALVEIAEALGRPLVHPARADAEQLRDTVRRALELGDLVAYRLRAAQVAIAAPEEKELRRGQDRVAEKKTFIEIELVDDESPPKPVAFRRYRVELPDYSTREGMLDARGRARIDGIDPGTCKVSFPDFSDDDWRAA
jgi:hypothetical protein